MEKRKLSRSFARSYLCGFICLPVITSFAQRRQDAGTTTNTNTKKEISMKMQSHVIGEGSPIVLVPGGLTGWISWETHANRLSATRKVIRVQLLNVQYGFEDRSLTSDYSVKTESRALAATLNELKLTEPLDLVAWSYGAMVTLDFALDHPGRVRTLTLIEPPAMWALQDQELRDEQTQKTIQMLKSLHGDISEEQHEQFLQRVGFLQPGQSASEIPQWSLWVRYRKSLRNSPMVVEHKDDRKRLEAFQPPVLLFKETGSAKFLNQIIDDLAAAFPHSRAIEMPAGHALHIVSMDRFLDELEKFQNGAANK